MEWPLSNIWGYQGTNHENFTAILDHLFCSIEINQNVTECHENANGFRFIITIFKNLQTKKDL